ncbi:MAG: TonB-dependent receptor [Puniceicoccaceae bacterium]|nr:MAG: TonB-dependent receptor [Puniceicoccaceae bacterium]
MNLSHQTTIVGARFSRLSSLLFLLALLLPVQGLIAQAITTGAIEGRVVDTGGRAVPDAELEIIHLPTGTRYTTATRSNGSFSLRGLRPGGPYQVVAESVGYARGVRRDVFVELDRAANVVLTLELTEIFELDELVVTGSDFDRLLRRGRTGAATQLGGDDIERAPVGDRSLNSILRLDPRIVYNRDPSDQSFSAGGLSNRYNSIQIDGVSASDPFGLNSNNTAAERNVIPLDAVGAIAISTSPFDARSGGFSGAQINAVTKSGGSTFSGSIYYLYRDQRFVRTKLEGVRVPDFKERTFGFTLGGPIVPEKLFFFLAFEKVKEDRNPPTITNFPTTAALTRIVNQASALGIDPGQALEAIDQVFKDDNLLVKLDWNIAADHRMTFRYNTVASERPTFPGYGNRNLSFDSHWYDQEIENTSYIGQLFSTWTPELTSEISLSYSEYRSEPTYERPLPQVIINNVPVQGTTQLGSVRFGTERSRHFNRLEVDTWTFEAFASHDLNLNNTLTFGYQLERSSIFNAFVQDFLGNYEFSNLEAFEAAAAAGWAGRYRHTFENTGVNPAAEFRESNHGLFVQNQFRANDRLTIVAGLRIDMPKFNEDPPFNADFQDAFGFANNATYDGNYVLQPRLGFNWRMDDEGTRQLRGGFGLFYGKMPRVWMSNSYSNTGSNFSSIDVRNAATPPFSPDPENQPLLDPAAAAQRVVALDPDFELPSRWKGTLGYDHRLGDFVFSVEGEFTWVNRDVLFQNINRSVDRLGPDGREIHSGVVDSRFEPDTIFLTNTKKGSTCSISASVERPRQDDGWYGRLSYINGRVREVQYGTSSVARSNWANRTIFNQGEDVASRGELEIKHRFLGVLQKDFEYAEGWRTTLSLVYDGRSGLPFSFVYSNDVNGDGVNSNDLIYVPMRGGDPRVRFASAQDEALFFQMVDRWDLPEGQVVGSASNRYPFVHQFDFGIVQIIPLPGWRHNLEVALDILNVGNLLNSSWGIIRGSNSFFVKSESAVRAALDTEADQWIYSNPNAELAAGEFAPHGGRGEPSSSRWAALLSLRYRF